MGLYADSKWTDAPGPGYIQMKDYMIDMIDSLIFKTLFVVIAKIHIESPFNKLT